MAGNRVWLTLFSAPLESTRLSEGSQLNIQGENMKNLLNRAAILVIIGAMMSITALATTTNRQVTFGRDVTVNGAPVKAGTYKATFDDQTGEFKLFRGKKVVANATARMEKVSGSYRGAYSLTADALVSMNMNSTSQAVIVNDGESMKALMP